MATGWKTSEGTGGCCIASPQREREFRKMSIHSIGLVFRALIIAGALIASLYAVTVPFAV